MGRWGWRVAIALGAALSAGCDDTLFGVAEEATDPGIEGYAGVLEIASNNCQTCHSAASATSLGNGLDLETDLHAATVGVQSSYGMPLVTPEDPDQSLFYLKVTGGQPDGTGNSMPPGTMLSTGFTDVVRGWIEDGAPAE